MVVEVKPLGNDRSTSAATANWLITQRRRHRTGKKERTYVIYRAASNSRQTKKQMRPSSLSFFQLSSEA